MKLYDLLQGLTDVTLPENADLSHRISSLCHDSRKAAQGCIFVCIKGATVDGHDYARMAYDRGCRIFAAEHDLPDLGEDAVVLLCRDTRITLA